MQSKGKTDLILNSSCIEVLKPLASAISLNLYLLVATGLACGSTDCTKSLNEISAPMATSMATGCGSVLVGLDVVPGKMGSVSVATSRVLGIGSVLVHLSCDNNSVVVATSVVAGLGSVDVLRENVSW